MVNADSFVVHRPHIKTTAHITYVREKTESMEQISESKGAQNQNRGALLKQ